jgi:OOP family OmpA-OmpF porin
MTDKKHQQARISKIGLAFAMALGTMGTAQAAEMGYLTESAGNPVFTGYGECWKAVGGIKKKFEQCGDVIEKPAPAPAPAPMDSDGDGVLDNMDKCPGTRAGAKVDADGCEIIPNLTMDLVTDEFAFDSAKLKPSMMSALDDVAAKIAATPGNESLTIVGHTDSKGAEGYNMELSLRRAKAVADYLASKGVSRAAMTIQGKGESQPVADNATEAGRAKNRRVEIHTR